MSASFSRPPESLRGPAQLVLAASLARRYYVDGRTKIEIADEYGLSRFKVARLLEAARDQGLVRIEISYPGAIDVDLSGRLQDAFGLTHAIVVDTQDGHEESLRRQLGGAAADLLTEIVASTDVLGLAWARSVSSMATQITRLPAIPVVQLTGALFRTAGEHNSPDDSSIDVVREVARVSGGRAYLFFAPFVVADAATARALCRQPDVARALDKIDSVSIAVAGIGHWSSGQSTLFEAAAEAERSRLARLGVCADVGGVFISADGTPMETPFNQRMVGVSPSQMKAIPEVIGIPYGVAKTPAVLAAIRGGMVNSLVTHTSLAVALLASE
jgi:DNA-binding transcriptional regulator LsrR (DeoR family)